MMVSSHRRLHRAASCSRRRRRLPRVDSNSETVATDYDCDGSLTADDCDDSNPLSTIVATDADCDGTVTANDCDDSDPLSTTTATDADCDGLVTAIDCDDFNPAIINLGSVETCPAESCQQILDLLQHCSRKMLKQ